MQCSSTEAGSPGIGHVHVPGKEAHRLHNPYVANRDSVVFFHRMKYQISIMFLYVRMCVFGTHIRTYRRTYVDTWYYCTMIIVVSS